MRSWNPWVCCLTIVGGAAVALLGMSDPALSFARPPRSAPGPLIGMGLPVAGIIVATLAAVCRFRRNE